MRSAPPRPDPFRSGASGLGLPISLELQDVSSADLVVGHRCELQLRLANRGHEPIGGIQISWSSTTQPGLQRARLGPLGVGHTRLIPLEITTDQPGTHRIDGLLDLPTASGAIQSFQFAQVVFRVRSAQAHQGPIHIDMRSARVVKMDGLGMPGAARGSALMGAGRWDRLPLMPLHATERAAWLAQQTPPEAGAIPSAVRIQHLRLAWDSPSEGPRESLVFGAASPTFGRLPDNLVRLLIEPCQPAERYPQNIELSCHISGRHLSICLQRGQPMVQDLGSTQGTVSSTLGALPARRLMPLKDGDRLDIAGVLQLQARVIRDVQGATSCVHLIRLNNLPERDYLWLPGRVGLDPTGPQLYGPPAAHAVELQWQDGRPCLINTGPDPVWLGQGQLQPGSLRYLQTGDRIALQSEAAPPRWITVRSLS